MFFRAWAYPHGRSGVENRGTGNARGKRAFTRPLFVVVILAFLVPLALSRFRRFRIPVVGGKILAGIISSRSSLPLVGDDPVLAVGNPLDSHPGP